MADAFISYRRKPSASLAMLIQEKIKNQHKVDGYLDTTRRDSTQVQFPERLMQAIEDAPVFICLLGDSTLESEWVLKEIRKAHELNKFCIPVFQESYNAPSNPEDAVIYLLNHDGVHIFDQKNIYIDTAVRDIANLIPRKSFNWTKFFLAIIGIPICIGFATWGFVVANQRLDDINASNPQTAQANVDEPVITEQASSSVASNTPSPEPPVTTEEVSLPVTTEEVLDPTIQLAIDGVTSNDEWTPYMQEFDSAEMMLVPEGCFTIGSTTEQSDEQNGNEVCLESFWIDKYEVTNDQYRSIGCRNFSSEAEQPRNCISWFEANDFCESRNMRLPNEAEWEFAARGPDALIYPWGNDFESNNVIYFSNSNGQSATVGSRPDGVSWVGAMDMSGNIWEWTNTIYMDYPYNADDGREDNTTDENMNAHRVLRGGSYNDSSLRSSDRFRNFPLNQLNYFGFRCARDFNIEEHQ